MKKLKLQMDELKVETFAAGEKTGGRGTVEGHYGTTHTQAGDTCDYTCEGYATSPGWQYPCVFC